MTQKVLQKLLLWPFDTEHPKMYQIHFSLMYSKHPPVLFIWQFPLQYCKRYAYPVVSYPREIPLSFIDANMQSCKSTNNLPTSIRGGSRGRVQGVHTPLSRADLRLSNTTGILQKNVVYWC